MASLMGHLIPGSAMGLQQELYYCEGESIGPYNVLYRAEYSPTSAFASPPSIPDRPTYTGNWGCGFRNWWRMGSFVCAAV